MINARREPNGRTNSIMNVLGTSVTWTQNVHLFTLKSFPVSDKEPVGITPQSRQTVTPHTSGQNETFADLGFQQQTSIHKAKGEMFIKILSVSLF